MRRTPRSERLLKKVPTGQREEPTVLHKPSCAGDLTCGDPQKGAREGRQIEEEGRKRGY